MSSGAVYGDAQGPQNEDTPYKATDLYGASKISGELYGLQYSDTYGMDIRNARLFFVYGPGKYPSHMHKVYQGLFGPLEGLDNIQAPNGSEQALDWTHVFDTATGIIKLFEAEQVTHRNFNISSGVPVDHLKIVEEVATIIGKRSNIQLGPGPFVVRGSPLDITRARKELSFEPRFTDIREGIRNYWNWLQTVHNN